MRLNRIEMARISCNCEKKGLREKNAKQRERERDSFLAALEYLKRNRVFLRIESDQKSYKLRLSRG